MESGYQIEWTPNALEELADTIHYLENHWTEKELTNLADSIDNVLELISRNPYLFQQSEAKRDVRRVVVKKYNTLYYRIKSNLRIEVLSFFSNRQNPNNIKV